MELSDQDLYYQDANVRIVLLYSVGKNNHLSLYFECTSLLLTNNSQKRRYMLYLLHSLYITKAAHHYYHCCITVKQIVC